MIHFKYLVVLTLVSVVSKVDGKLRLSSWGPRIQSIAAPLHSLCTFRTGINEYSIDNVLNGIFIDEPTIKSYAACIFKESGLMSEKGELNYPLGAYLFPDDIRDEAVSNARYCDDEAKGIKNVEDRLFKMLECYYDLDPDIFIFF